MQTYRATCHVGKDGVLNIQMPVHLKNADVEIAVVVQLVKQHEAPLQTTQKSERFPRSSDEWKPAEDQQLLALLDEGLSIQAVAQRLRRRPRAVEARALRLERQLKDRKETD